MPDKSDIDDESELDDFMKFVTEALNVLLKICGVLLQIATTITLPFVMYMSLKNGSKIDTAAVKAGEAAVKADVAATEAIEVRKDTASTNAINTAYQARVTGDPEDKAKAAVAAERLEKVVERVP